MAARRPPYRERVREGDVGEVGHTQPERREKKTSTVEWIRKKVYASAQKERPKRDETHTHLGTNSRF